MHKQSPDHADYGLTWNKESKCWTVRLGWCRETSTYKIQEHFGVKKYGSKRNANLEAKRFRNKNLSIVDKNLDRPELRANREDSRIPRAGLTLGVTSNRKANGQTYHSVCIQGGMRNSANHKEKYKSWAVKKYSVEGALREAYKYRLSIEKKPFIEAKFQKLLSDVIRLNADLLKERNAPLYLSDLDTQNKVKQKTTLEKEQRIKAIRDTLNTNVVIPGVRFTHTPTTIRVSAYAHGTSVLFGYSIFVQPIKDSIADCIKARMTYEGIKVSKKECMDIASRFLKGKARKLKQLGVA